MPNSENGLVAFFFYEERQYRCLAKSLLLFLLMVMKMIVVFLITFFLVGEFIQYLFPVTFFSFCFHDAQRAGGLA